MDEARKQTGLEHVYRSEFQRLIGWEVTEWGDGHAVVTCEVRREFMNRGDNLHGGLVATLIDAAAGYAALGPPPAEPGTRGQPGATLSLTINYLGTVREGQVVATATRTGGGKTIAYVRVEITDGAGRPLAEAVGTFRRFPGRASA